MTSSSDSITIFSGSDFNRFSVTTTACTTASVETASYTTRKETYLMHRDAHRAVGDPHQPTPTLQVAIHNCVYPIDVTILAQIFVAFGPRFAACGNAHTTTVGYVEFTSAAAASRAMHQMQGKYIYPDCCRMSLSFVDQSIQGCGEVIHRIGVPLPPGYVFRRCLSAEVNCMSCVVEALDINKRPVVLKKAVTPENQKYIEREFHILQQCSTHPHIVQLTTEGLVDGWLVVEFMGGGSFDAECEIPQNLTHREVLQIAEATSIALAFLHGNHILHRDVKPHNVFFERNVYNEIVSIKLADMGLAVSLPTSGSVLFAGTKRYAAPEAIRNEASPASDMWSWACTIAHLATGVKPYEGDDNSLPYSQELQDTELPTEFYELLKQCYNQRPSIRPAASEAALRCRRCLASLPADEDILGEPNYPPARLPAPSSSTSHVPVAHASRNEDPPSDFSPANHIDQLAALANAVTSPGREVSDLTLLIGASANGDADMVRVLLARGVETDFPDPKGWPALMHASANGHVEVVAELLAHGAQTEVDNNGTSLLHATSNGHTEVVSALLNAGAALDAVDVKGRTALMHASLSSHTEILQLLLTHGAEVNATDRLGSTALMHGSFGGHTEVVDVLLDSGATLDVRHKYGSTVLTHACSAGHVEMVRVLLSHGAPIDETDSVGYTPLIHSCCGNFVEIVSMLLTHGASVNAADEQNWSALVHACAAGYMEVVRALLAHGAEVDLPKQYLRADALAPTALASASANGHTEIVVVLLARGAAIEALDNQLWTPLINASNAGWSDIVLILLAHGAAIDVTDDVGMTALMHASVKNRPDVVGLLLAHGATLEGTDNKGRTAIVRANEKRHTLVTAVLLGHATTLLNPYFLQ